MSKKSKHETPANEVSNLQPAGERREVERHRQCPVCYTGALNGVGTAQSTQRRTRYYKCDRCGHTWTATVTTTVERIEHREVDVETRDV